MIARWWTGNLLNNNLKKLSVSNWYTHSACRGTTGFSTGFFWDEFSRFLRKSLRPPRSDKRVSLASLVFLEFSLKIQSQIATMKLI